MSQTTFAFHIPTSNEVVLLVEIFFNPAALQGGGSLSAPSLPYIHRFLEQKRHFCGLSRHP
jgi:hypothetical protein